MESQESVLEKLLKENQNAIIFPKNHSKLQIRDVLFFNMGSQLRKNEIWSHTTAYNLIFKEDSLFLDSFVSDAFIVI